MCLEGSNPIPWTSDGSLMIARWPLPVITATHDSKMTLRLVHADVQMPNSSPQKECFFCCLANAMSMPAEQHTHDNFPFVRCRKSPNSLLGKALTEVSRAVVFPHFCAGETLEDCRAVGERYGAMGVRMLVDHSVEESETEEVASPDLPCPDLHTAIESRRSYLVQTLYA